MTRRLSCLVLACVCGVVPLRAQQRAVAAADPITLEAAIARAIEGHPTLAASRIEVDARTAEVAQAGRRPNPTVSADVEDLGRTVGSSMPAQTTVSLGQRFELGGKRQLRTTLAMLEKDSASWDLAIARANLEGRVAQAYLRVLVADAELSLARADAETAREVAATVDARVTAGVAAPPELDRAEAASAMARISVMRVEQSRKEAVISLTSTWGAPAAGSVELDGVLAASPAVPPLESLEAAIDASPLVARWSTEQDRREKTVDAVRAAKVPDLDLGAGYRRLHDVESHAWVVGATISWPLFDRQRDRLTAASLRVEGVGQKRAAVVLAARESLAVAHASATMAQATLVDLDGRVLPLSERAYSAVLEGYQAGRFGLLEVLDARRSLSEARRDRGRTLADLHRALMTIQTTLGATPVLAASPSVQGERQ